VLDPDTSLRLAVELEAAQLSRVPVRQFSLRHPDMTVDDGYGIQRAWMGLKQQSGRTLRGHKIGLTSRAMQQSSQID